MQYSSVQTNARHHALVLQHLPLVRDIAKKMHRGLPPHVDLDDLIGDGMLGLLDAARKFDPRKRTLFPSYAKYRIRGAITDGLRRLDPLPRTLRQQRQSAERAIVHLSQKLQEQPTDAEIARHLQMPLERWRQLAECLYEAGQPVNGHCVIEQPIPVVENLRSAWHSPEEMRHRAELRYILTEAMRALPLRYQKVITLYHDREWTMKEIARELEVNESRVSQIHSAAIRRMRAYLGSELEGQC